MAGRAVLKAAWGPSVVVAAFVAAAAVAFVAFAFVGVLVGEPFLQLVAQPVAALVTGVGAALAAAWTATLLAPDRSRTRLLRVLAWTEAATLAGFLLFALLSAAGEGPPATALAPLVVLASGGAAFSALRERGPRGSLRRDAWVSAGLLLLIPLALYGVLGLACLFGECGA